MNSPLRVLIGCEKPCPRGSVGYRAKNGRCQCEACKALNAARKKKWTQKNPDRAKAYTAKWVAENPEKRAQAVNAWRDKNPEKIKEISARAGARWSKKRRDKRAAYRAKARAIETNSIPPWADMDAIEAFYTRAAKLTEETGIPHEVDHVLPLNGREVCGLHVEANLQIITRSENRRKGRRANV